MFHVWLAVSGPRDVTMRLSLAQSKRTCAERLMPDVSRSIYLWKIFMLSTIMCSLKRGKQSPGHRWCCADQLRRRTSVQDFSRHDTLWSRAHTITSWHEEEHSGTINALSISYKPSQAKHKHQWPHSYLERLYQTTCLLPASTRQWLISWILEFGVILATNFARKTEQPILSRPSQLKASIIHKSMQWWHTLGYRDLLFCFSNSEDRWRDARRPWESSWAMSSLWVNERDKKVTICSKQRV